MKIIYRISDGGYNKIKPYYVTKKGVFQHFIKIFEGYDIYVVADNVSEETYKFLSLYIDSSKIFRTNLSNAGSFIYSVNFAINTFNDNDKIYFAEDDYIYTKNAPMIIEEGLDLGDYSSGYDHPDKYINYSEGGPNPYIKDGGEFTTVKISKNRHWKITNSCCMTFATRIITLKKDLSVFEKYCNGPHPYDFQIFIELKQANQRNVVSCIPAVSTHGETELLSPFINWEEECLNNSKSMTISKYTAIIIEPRKHKAFYFVINNFLNGLSDDWNIIIFHGIDNEIYIKDIIQYNFNESQIKRIKFINLGIQNLTINEYNKLLTNQKLYDFIETEIFMVFQIDTLILNKEKINLFINKDYDYVGAPWSHSPIYNEQVGNGGLSLRKKSKMLEIIKNTKYEGQPEDIYFCYNKNIEIKKPSVEEAMEFSVENIFYDKPFGCHQPWDRMFKNEFIKIYPQVEILEILNKYNKPAITENSVGIKSNVSNEPFFHILGYYSEHTGYGIHTKEFINVLITHKKDFLFTDISEIKTYADREKINMFLSEKQNVYNISISYGSECYNIVKDFNGLKIGWTVWESTIIPDNWKNELNKLDQVWIPSKWGKNILITNGIDKDKIKVVPEGVNIEVFKRIKQLPENNITKLKGFKFLNIGKYEGRKNTDLLIRAFDEEFNKDEEVFLFLQSYNIFIPNFNMNKIIDSMNLRNREKIYTISPVKNHNDLSVIYNSCDCFVYPSRAEGWGLPLIEALSCGMNVISCNNGGQSEYLYNSVEEIFTDLKYTMVDITRKDFGNYLFHTNNENKNMGQWAEIEMNELKNKMRLVFENNKNDKNHKNDKNDKNINIVGMKHIHQNWSWAKLLENENLYLSKN